MSDVAFKRGWCPSLLRPMESGDGWLSRVRPRMGVISAEWAGAVADAAGRFGNGRIEITNRANLQIRGLRPETSLSFIDAMREAGAADDGEGAGRILVSPLTGTDPSLARETLTIAQALALGLQPRARPSGRPDGVMVPQGVGPRVKPGDDNTFPPAYDGSLLPTKFGVVIDGGGALPLTGIALDITLRFTSGEWHLNGEPCPAAVIAERVLTLTAQLAQAPRQVRQRSGTAPALGFRPYGQRDEGFLLFAPPFGQLHATQLAALADLARRFGDGGLRPTPWKSLAIAGVLATNAALLTEAAERLGMITDAADLRLGIVTCVGAPACPRGTIDTTGTATLLAAKRRAGDPLLHLSGCAKGCAHPGPAPLTLVGADGKFDLIRDGRPGDIPTQRHLTLAQISALMQSLPRMTDRYDYIRDGAAIYARSFAIIRAESDLSRFTPEEARIAVRMIHGSGMVEIAEAIRFGGDFARAGRSALLAGAPILCDSKMVAHGITRARLPAGNEVICTLDALETPALAARIGNTRSAAALDLWGDRLEGAVVAIGNAPTALFHLLELLDAGAPLPAAVIGLPVGFVGAAESKAVLAADGRVPFLIVEGRRGGSAMAVSAVNALASEAE